MMLFTRGIFSFQLVSDVMCPAFSDAMNSCGCFICLSFLTNFSTGCIGHLASSLPAMIMTGASMFWMWVTGDLSFSRCFFSGIGPPQSISSKMRNAASSRS